ncbi:DNA gyrase subunit A [Halorhodospira abdelmalekii]|uniref:DNA gyrase subunit A n=1 Tax=Halorhodospira abdelmalekii TaxID=421629 RepID=UPI00190782F9|nr:DNA gyrase subunit A [Halorhodospira abdelmalekii]MBK1734522.1 DNA gyrase subunit A [Halorhodospira abdelmalekii]
MSGVAREILPVNLEDEMRQSYLDYAMSVIVGRALPDVRDGLKPVHRRVLFAMRELGNDYNKPYKKSARVVGDVIGKYHPHGDAAVYDTIVRLAQTFSMRYRLVDGQGNFGSIDGDSAAAMRYTEVRMARLAHELLADIDKETVDFADNYDGSEREPQVLPTKVPNLLVNGGSGIAVGMATNIPPHNLCEVIDACLLLIDDEQAPIEALIERLPAPDLPTGGIIFGTAGIHQAYRSGRGRMVMRARAEVEPMAGDRERIVVTELPFQVNKARLVEKIAELVKERRLEGISELRDESDKDGIRIVIELKRGEAGEVILNNLYRHTQMQTVFGINMVALHEGQPRTLNLQQVLEAFIRHRREVVTRRTLYELRKARERAHVLEGLAVALANIDEVIALIKASSGPAEAKAELIRREWRPGVVVEMLERAGASASRPEELSAEFGLDAERGTYRLSAAQAQAILDLRLHRLTAMEQDKIVAEYGDLLQRIAELIAILESSERLMEVIREELVAIREQYGDARKTEIREDTAELSLEDLISEEDMVVTLSHHGYVKAQPLAGYRAQRRGGRGKSATAMKDEDFIDKLFIANTHDTLLCFSSAGKCYWRKVYELPQGGRASRGRPIVNLLPLEPTERINAVVPVREFAADHFVFMATRCGTVKKTPLSHFSRPRPSGIIAVELRGDDTLVDAEITNGEREVMLISDAGSAVRFHESEVRAMGRTAGGVRGIRLEAEQRVIALLILGEGDILTATEHGYGKRTAVTEYPQRKRGGMGVIAIRTSPRNGRVVGAVQAAEDDEIMLITRHGTLVRTPVADISRVGRNTQGVKLISLGPDEPLVGLERVEALGEEDEAEENGAENGDEAGSENEAD